MCLEKSLYLFDLETMQRLQDMDTASNPKGLVALTPREEPRWVWGRGCVRVGGGEGHVTLVTLSLLRHPSDHINTH